LHSYGWDLDIQEIVQRFTGRSHAHFVKALEGFIGKPLSSAWEAEYLRRERELFVERLQPVPGISAALDAIATQTCVASSGSYDKMRLTLSLTGLYNRFKGRIFSGEDVSHGKPAPDLFLYAAKRMNVAEVACLVVEDSSAGVRAARAAGMATLGYAGGVTSAESLNKAGAFVFSSMAELPGLVHAF
jgi:HAD superfamily hydrolase (TIGR01509 family)